MYNWSESKYFKSSEFDSRDLPGSGVNMRPEFMKMLEFAREIAGIEFKINSGYRTISRNRSVGGRPNSAHLLGLAADISAKTEAQFTNILHACILAGFDRIGIMETAIHVDCNPAQNPAMWSYDPDSEIQHRRTKIFKHANDFYRFLKSKGFIVLT
jgi:hypothetical protein